ncbi:MAG TPA: hypothetical protein VG326_13890 [Tepidisphaeraceae bacterium]|jgi:hypothetical protein|nr:hypothetical protein [Tepidisphaeraceae bacterium]
MQSLTLPRLRELRAVLKKVTSMIPALGIIGTQTGRVYHWAACDVDGADHAILVKDIFRVYDIDKALHLRGFVVGNRQRTLANWQ